MKRLIALLLALALCCSFMSACGKTEEKKEPQQEQQDDAPAEVEDDGVLKILMIGHSLGNDSTFLVPDVFKNEGAENLVMGVIYHSGCRLGQHVQYIEKDAAQYAYYEYDISKDSEWLRADSQGNFTAYIPGTPNDEDIANGTIAQTMKFGISRHDWDIIVTQAGVFEAADVVDGDYLPNFASDIKTIFDYVLKNDIEPATEPKFAWNITWTCPSDNMLNATYKTNLYNNFADADAMYQAIVATAKNTIVPAYDFDYVFPSGTAMQNARSSALEPKDLYRDTIHANDYGRLIVAYTWYCVLTGTDINDCKFGTMNNKVLLSEVHRNFNIPFELTELQQNVLVESVANAIANPYEMTQSAN